MSYWKHRQSFWPVVLVVAAGLVGCESETSPTRKPMDEPLTTEDALEAGDQMQRDADALLREHEERLVAPPR